ncbi:hypothetical protein OEZ85_001979 [Tetradesmus obliquus]|uniref:Uncharacterized protein n=1 Tax=Tetradesmus obliquus TaxID=3088 RepID=A0ABY8U230_TETOB|nr:hypothetical protein OEZ85_001979 [Tetradesmus obliquus]
MTSDALRNLAQYTAPGSIKPSLGGLLLDLGLAAAGRAGDWHAGAAIVSSARTIQAGGKGSSSRSSKGSADVAPERQQPGQCTAGVGCDKGDTGRGGRAV